MMRVLLVEKIDENPLTVLGSADLDAEHSDWEAAVGAIVKRHNEHALVKADGAFAWSLEGNARQEFRLDGGDLRSIDPVESFNLHGSYTCPESGNKYKYYGKYTAFTAGRDSNWEAYVFNHDKKFRYDGIFNSRDLLTKLKGPLLNIRISAGLLRALVVDQAEMAIERWDAALCGSNRAGLDN
jgi:hypothetical protein